MYKNTITNSYGGYDFPEYQGDFRLKFFRMIIWLGSILFPSYTKKKLSEMLFKPRAAKEKPGDNFLESASVVGEVVLSSGKRNTYYIWGNTQPDVLLVHGWESNSTHLRIIVDCLVKKGYSVVSFDACAHGRSSGSNADLNDFIDGIASLSKKFSSIRLSIGYSFGGISLLNAIRRGVTFEKVGIISSPSSFYGIFEKLAAQLKLTKSVRAHLSQVILKRYGIKNENWDEYSTYDFASKMNIPLVAIHDEHDTYVLSIESKILTTLWPDSKLMLTDRLGHRGILKNRPAINSFIDQLKT